MAPYAETDDTDRMKIRELELIKFQISPPSKYSAPTICGLCSLNSCFCRGIWVFRNRKQDIWTDISLQRISLENAL